MAAPEKLSQATQFRIELEQTGILATRMHPETCVKECGPSALFEEEYYRTVELMYDAYPAKFAADPPAIVALAAAGLTVKRMLARPSSEEEVWVAIKILAQVYPDFRTLLSKAKDEYGSAGKEHGMG